MLLIEFSPIYLVAYRHFPNHVDTLIVQSPLKAPRKPPRLVTAEPPTWFYCTFPQWL